MASLLALAWLVTGIDNRDLGAISIGDLASFHLETCLGAYPVDFSGYWTRPEYWDADDITLELPENPYIWTDGRREDFSSIGGFEVAGAGVYLPASELAFDGLIWGTAEEYGDARLERCRAFLLILVFCKLFSVLNSGVLLLLCRLTGPAIQVLTTLMLLVALVVCLIVTT